VDDDEQTPFGHEYGEGPKLADMMAAMGASPALPSQVEGVKELTWPHDKTAMTPFGLYEVSITNNGSFDAHFSGMRLGNFPDRSSAQKACQADFNAPIQSCLTSPAAEPVAYQQRERRVAPDGSVTVWSEWHWTPQAAYLEFCRDGGDRSKFQYEVRPLYTHPAPSASREVTVTDADVQPGIAWLNGSVGSAEPCRLKQAADKILALLAALPEREV
jgi:hypothetical protein